MWEKWNFYYCLNCNPKIAWNHRRTACVIRENVTNEPWSISTYQEEINNENDNKNDYASEHWENGDGAAAGGWKWFLNQTGQWGSEVSGRTIWPAAIIPHCKACDRWLHRLPADPGREIFRSCLCSWDKGYYKLTAGDGNAEWNCCNKWKFVKVK